MSREEIVKLAVNLSNDDPELCAEIAITLDRIYNEGFAAGFAAGVASNPKLP